MTDGHTLRVWLWLTCRDYEGWLYRDVTVPVLPRMVHTGKEWVCDFTLTGLYATSTETWMRMRDGTNCYRETQPDEQLYDLCYDIIDGIWHVSVYGHLIAGTWENAKAHYYADWTISSRDGGPRVIPPKLPKTTPVTTVIPNKSFFVSDGAGGFKPWTVPAEDEAKSRGLARITSLWQKIRTLSMGQVTKLFAEPDVVEYLKGQAARHTDPRTPVAEALKGGALSVPGEERKLRLILKYLAPARLEGEGADPVLRVGDLAGKTYGDIGAIRGVGQGALVALVAAGLVIMGVARDDQDDQETQEQAPAGAEVSVPEVQQDGSAACDRPVLG